MIIDNEKGAVVISIPKTGSSSIYESICGTGCRYPEPFIYHAPLTRILKIRPNIINYTKFAFIRHPLDRLVSVYHDFTCNRGPYYSQYNVLDAPLLSEFTSFEDFCLRLDDSIWHDDIFFLPQFDFISINKQLAIDYIGKFENIEYDFNAMCHIVGWEDRKLMHIRPSNHNHYEQYYTAETKQKIKQRYKVDFEVFKYE